MSQLTLERAMEVEQAGMPAQPDPRQRGKVKLDALRSSSLNVSHKIRIHHLLALLVTKTMVASAAWLTRQWLLVPQVDTDFFQLQQDGILASDAGRMVAQDNLVHEPASLWAVATVSMSMAAFFLLTTLRVWRWDIELTSHSVRHLLVLGAVIFLQLISVSYTHLRAHET